MFSFLFLFILGGWLQKRRFFCKRIARVVNKALCKSYPPRSQTEVALSWGNPINRKLCGAIALRGTPGRMESFKIRKVLSTFPHTTYTLTPTNMAPDSGSLQDEMYLAPFQVPSFVGWSRCILGASRHGANPDPVGLPFRAKQKTVNRESCSLTAARVLGLRFCPSAYKILLVPPEAFFARYEMASSDAQFSGPHRWHVFRIPHPFGEWRPVVQGSLTDKHIATGHGFTFSFP